MAEPCHISQASFPSLASDRAAASVTTFVGGDQVCPSRRTETQTFRNPGPVQAATTMPVSVLTVERLSKPRSEIVATGPQSMACGPAAG